MQRLKENQKRMRVGISICFIIIFISLQTAFGQINSYQLGGQNTITTAVPFLLISPDARAGAMGDAGVATPNDINAIHWNAAKMVFNEKSGAIGVSYTPWLRALVPDISLSYLSFYSHINKQSSFGASLRYFSLGEIQFTDIVGNTMGNYTPNELAVDVGYAQKLSDKFSMGLAFRYIYSNLAGGANLAGIKAGTSFAADITAYYKDNTRIKGYKFNYGIGGAISNMGNKVTYTTAAQENFIPINLRLGTYIQHEIDKYNSIALLVDFNKLLVPTPPVYKRDANDNIMYDANNEPVIEKGKKSNVPIVAGMMQSFYDAPGGFKEEISEFNTSVGLEYWYEKQFALRGGYFYEPFTKGNRKYATIGAGIRYSVFTIDVAYLFSFMQRHPMDNTLRFSLGFDFDAFKEQKEGNDNKNGVFTPPSN